MVPAPDIEVAVVVMNIKPGDLVTANWPDESSVTLWKSLGGDGIAGRLQLPRCALVLARYVSPENHRDLGDQILVLTDTCQLGWNETRLFMPI